MATFVKFGQLFSLDKHIHWDRCDNFSFLKFLSFTNTINLFICFALIHNLLLFVKVKQFAKFAHRWKEHQTKLCWWQNLNGWKNPKLSNFHNKRNFLQNNAVVIFNKINWYCNSHDVNQLGKKTVKLACNRHYVPLLTVLVQVNADDCVLEHQGVVHVEVGVNDSIAGELNHHEGQSERRECCHQDGALIPASPLKVENNFL